MFRSEALLPVSSQMIFSLLTVFSEELVIKCKLVLLIKGAVVIETTQAECSEMRDDIIIPAAASEYNYCPHKAALY